MADRATLIQELGDTTSRFKRAIHQFAFNNFSDHGGLTPAQLTLLRMIYCSQPISPKRLAQQMQLTPGAVSQLLDGLEEDGCIIRTRDEADRRASRVSISRRGKRLMDEYVNLRNQLLGEAFSDVSDEDIETFIRVQQSAAEWLETQSKKSK